MDLYSEGMSGIKVIMIIVLGLITVGAVWGFASSFISDSEGKVNPDETGPQISKGTCAADCRQDHPSGGAEYESCKSSC